MVHQPADQTIPTRPSSQPNQRQPCKIHNQETKLALGYTVAEHLSSCPVTFYDLDLPPRADCGFSKSKLGNIREDEEAQFKKMAKYVLSLTDAQLSELVANGQFEEVVKNV